MTFLCTWYTGCALFANHMELMVVLNTAFNTFHVKSLVIMLMDNNELRGTSVFGAFRNVFSFVAIQEIR